MTIKYKNNCAIISALSTMSGDEDDFEDYPEDFEPEVLISDDIHLSNGLAYVQEQALTDIPQSNPPDPPSKEKVQISIQSDDDSVRRSDVELTLRNEVPSDLLSSTFTSPDRKMSRSMTTKIVRAQGSNIVAQTSVSSSNTYDTYRTLSQRTKAHRDREDSVSSEPVQKTSSTSREQPLALTHSAQLTTAPKRGEKIDPNRSDFSSSSSMRYNWVQYVSAEGWPYYYDTISGQSSWDAPIDWTNKDSHKLEDASKLLEFHDIYQKSEEDGVSGSKSFENDWESVQGYVSYGLNIISKSERKASTTHPQTYSHLTRRSMYDPSHYQFGDQIETMSLSSLSDDDVTHNKAAAVSSTVDKPSREQQRSFHSTRDSWIECLTQEGKPYYYNQITQLVQWENPHLPKHSSGHEPAHSSRRTKVVKDKSSKTKPSIADRNHGHQEKNNRISRSDEADELGVFYDSAIEDMSLQGKQYSDRPPLPKTREISHKKGSDKKKDEGLTTVEKRHLLGKSHRTKEEKVLIDTTKAKHLVVWNRFFENAMKMKEQSKRTNEESTLILGKNRIADLTVSWPPVPRIEDCEEMLQRALSLVDEADGDIGEDGQLILNSSLLSVCYCGLADEALLLLQSGADAQCRDGSQRTPAHFASKAGEVSVLGILLDYGADLEARDMYSYSPLHVTSDCSDGIDVMKYLLESAVDPSMPIWTTSDTALHICARNGSFELCKLLLEYGATITKNKIGKTPLAVAMDLPYKDDNIDMTIQFLKKFHPNEKSSLWAPETPKSPKSKMTPFADLGLQLDLNSNGAQVQTNPTIAEDSISTGADSSSSNSGKDNIHQKRFLTSMITDVAWMAALSFLGVLSTFLAKLASNLSTISNGTTWSNYQEENNDEDNSGVVTEVLAPPTDFELSQKGLGFRNDEVAVSRDVQNDDMLASLMAPPVRSYRNFPSYSVPAPQMLPVQSTVQQEHSKV